MSLLPEISASQLMQSSLAVPAFVPAALSPGYAAAWLANLHGFRRRSLVERICWSLPLSIAISGISCYLLGRIFSLLAVVVFLVLATIFCVAAFAYEAIHRHRTKSSWPVGFHPFGTHAIVFAVSWIVIALLSLADIQHGQQVFMNVAMVDQSFRIHWIDSILNTGVPPDNPAYMLGHPESMRNYYFWYVICAAVAKLSHLPTRAVSAASSVWVGLSLIALGGLYLKHFLRVGTRLRTSFLNCIWLLMVCGLDVLVLAVDLFGFKITPPADFDIWSEDAIFGWINSFLWTPHHVASLICCMMAFLLASRIVSRERSASLSTVSLLAFCLASAFGLSVYVTLAFFMAITVWALWQLLALRTPRSAYFLAAGGAAACILLIPYLRELTHAQYGMHGTFPLQFAVRQMVPPDALLAILPLSHLATTHPILALNLAKLLLLIPGYALELGFFLVVFAIYMVPRWRGRIRITREHYSLIFLTCAVFPFISLIRSQMVRFNDFGFRGALLVQFSLWILAAEFLAYLNTDTHSPKTEYQHRTTPHWIRSLAALTLAIGMLGGIGQTLWDRTVTLIADWKPTNNHSLSHNAYISAIGFDQLNRAIPRSSVVQFDPGIVEPFWQAAIQINIRHQNVISGYQPSCGAEIGGDPRGCPQLASAIHQLFVHETATEARASCHALHIDFLVARVYDPIWQDRASWVWTLPAIVRDDEFRALDCR